MEGGRIVQHGVPQDIVLKPANEYVAEFVQHMNPLNVLTGDVMMRPLDGLAKIGGALVLDQARGLTLKLPAKGGQATVAMGPKPVPMVSETGDGGRYPAGHIAALPVSAPMRAVIEARRQTGLPVMLVDGERVVGVVRDEEIYAGLLARANAPAAPG
jgi:glycine betaine/proline transport system ATP-binding protein